MIMVTLTQKNKERGRRARQRRREARASRTAQQPGPSGSPLIFRYKKVNRFAGLNAPERPNVTTFKILFIQVISKLSSF